MIMGGVVTGVAAMAWSLSAEREFRNEMPRVGFCRGRCALSWINVEAEKERQHGKEIGSGC
jgi:hypothetical protein